MLSFFQSYESTEKRVWNTPKRRYETIVTVPFTPAQYADLGASLELLLGEQFVSWNVTQHPEGVPKPLLVETAVEYNGLLDEFDQEIDRTTDISNAYLAWEQSY
jgi:hypothetical protein